MMLVSTLVTRGAAVACCCWLLAEAPLVMMLASSSRLNWRVALTAAWTLALPVRFRLLTLGTLTLLIPLAEMFTAAEPLLMSA